MEDKKPNNQKKTKKSENYKEYEYQMNLKKPKEAKKLKKKKNKINPELHKKAKMPQNKKEYNILNLSIEEKNKKV